MKRVIAGIAIAAFAGIALASNAAAVEFGGDGSSMYRVGTDIPPGEYSYTIGAWGVGTFQVCADTVCEVDAGLIDQDVVSGSGYMTVPASAKYVKLNGLRLSPA